MSQDCPGPASAPVGSPSAAQIAFPVAAVNKAMDQGAALIAQLTAKALQWIQAQLEDGVATVTGLATTIATPITAGLNDGEAAVNNLAGKVQDQITGQIASLSSQTAGGGTVDQGIKPGQYLWNVYQFINPPYPSRSVAAAQLAGVDTELWCFRGSWENAYDAIKFQQGIYGNPPPPGCQLPGGPAVLLPPNQQQGGCPPWYVYVDRGTPDRPATGNCQLGCSPTDPVPAGWVLAGGPFATSDQAQAFLATLGCGSPPTGQSPWLAGCSADGVPTAWLQGGPSPAGVTVLPGEFPTEALALAAAQTSCAPPPPPPPPPTGNGTGPCCDETGTVKLPKCIFVDLCDWKKFEDSLVNALCRWYEKCVCRLTNDVAFEFDDCDGTLTDGLGGWFGGGVGGVAVAPTMEDAAAGGKAFMDLAVTPPPNQPRPGNGSLKP